MTHLDYLVGRRFEKLVHREYDWMIVFENQASLVIGCLWRLIEANRIRVTSEDDGQRFGRPSPVDAAAEVNERLAGSRVTAVDLKDHTLDVLLTFDGGMSMQIIPDSSGYEAWVACLGKRRQIIAIGGGDVAVVDQAADGEPTDAMDSRQRPV